MEEGNSHFNGELSEKWKQVEQAEKDTPIELRNVKLTAVETRREGETEPYYHVEGQDLSQGEPVVKSFFAQWVVDSQGNRMTIEQVAKYNREHPSVSMKLYLDNIDINPGIKDSQRRSHYGQFIEN